jgi:hypothetical protein
MISSLIEKITIPSLRQITYSIYYYKVQVLLNHVLVLTLQFPPWYQKDKLPRHSFLRHI